MPAISAAGPIRPADDLQASAGPRGGRSHEPRDPVMAKLTGKANIRFRRCTRLETVAVLVEGIRAATLPKTVASSDLLLVPPGEFRSELIPECLKLTDPCIDCCEVFAAKGQHLCARLLPGARELKDLGDLGQRKAERLRLLDETELLDRLLRVP